MSDTVLCDIRDKVALLTLNRPAKLNAESKDPSTAAPPTRHSAAIE